MASMTMVTGVSAVATARGNAAARVAIQQQSCSLVWGNRSSRKRICIWDEGKKRNAGLVRIADDDVEEQADDHIESTLDMLDEGADTDEFQLMSDFGGSMEDEEESEAAAGTTVNYKINEDEFHKISLHECDFFIRKVPDPDDDVYDFKEMYVTPPDTDVYSIPKVIGKMPQQKARCRKSTYKGVYFVQNEDLNNPRAPMGKNEFRVLKVFLMKHLYNRRERSKKFVLNFEKIYVIDGKTKSIRKAKVKVDVPGGKDRDRTKEILTVRDLGTSFRIIPQEQRKTKDEIINEFNWRKTRLEMEDYLKGFRDFEVSNWF